MSHLLYADDFLIWVKASPNAEATISDIFDSLDKFVGLKIDEHNTKCYFNKWCRNKQDILTELKVREGELPVKYFGVPLSSNVITDKECRELKNKIRDKLNGRSSKLLSFASRIDLVHTIISAMVMFWMQIFQIQMASVLKIESLCANFI